MPKQKKSLTRPPAFLMLEDGTVFEGKSVGVEGMRTGEVVFNTAITGYQEILTDPSYARQLITLTHPHIGNTGATDEDCESRRVFCAGLIVKDAPSMHSNWRAQSDLREFLIKHDTVAISDIDTRQLTRLIRTKGAQRGCIVAGTAAADKDAAVTAKKMALAFSGLGGMDLAKEVSCESEYAWHEGIWRLESGYDKFGQSVMPAKPPATKQKYKVVACDYGVKHAILRILADRGCELIVVPAQTPAAQILAHNPDGVFLSNGPGDPQPCDYAIETIGELLAREVPIFGICLGHQLLALASGARTEKMKFGHHGANHPVRDLEDGRVLITSQNHGFAVQESSLPKNLRITHRSLFDQTVQGLARTDKPAFSFQGHPEASPGPHDIVELFDRFIDLMKSHAQTH